jgi:CO/xanthine dehydrogenase Mo-binding subunit
LRPVSRNQRAAARTAAAIANAIYHATGKRVRELPITIDKLLEN